MGSEDTLQKFLKGIFVQEGSNGTRFDHGQFEIKTFPIYAPPYCQVIYGAKYIMLYIIFVPVVANAPISAHPSNFEIISHKITNHRGSGRVYGGVGPCKKYEIDLCPP